MAAGSATRSKGRIVATYALLVVGVLSALMSVVYGTAASPDYRLVLTAWAACALGATLAFALAAVLGSKLTRWTAIVLLAVTWLAGVEPAQRLLWLYL